MITSISIKAQINITPSQLKETNKIFAEHKQQKLIIKEQDKQILTYEKQINIFENKVLGLEQIIVNKDSIFTLTEQKNTYEKDVLNSQISSLKVQKRQITFIAIITTILSIGVLFAK